jgi:hypothetical protein
MATPHSAMAHPGSTLAIYRKSLAGFLVPERVQYRNRTIEVPCTAGLQEVAKRTVPSFSGSSLACSCCAANAVDTANHWRSTNDRPKYLNDFLIVAVILPPSIRVSLALRFLNREDRTPGAGPCDVAIVLWLWAPVELGAPWAVCSDATMDQTATGPATESRPGCDWPSVERPPVGDAGAASSFPGWDRTRTRLREGGGFLAPPFRLRGRFTIPPASRFPRPPYNPGQPSFSGPVRNMAFPPWAFPRLREV